MKSLTSYITTESYITESEGDALVKKNLAKYEVIKGKEDSSKGYSNYTVICRSKSDISSICAGIVSIILKGEEDKSILDDMVKRCTELWNNSPLEEKGRYIEIPFFA